MHDYVYISIESDGDTVGVRFMYVNAKRKEAIDTFASWAIDGYTDAKQEKDMGIQWVQSYVNPDLGSNCQWAFYMGKFGTKMILEVLLGTILVKGHNIAGHRSHWYGVKNNVHYEVVSRSWTNPGTAGYKYLGMAFDRLSMKQKTDIVCVAYQDYDAQLKSHMYSPSTDSQQNVLSTFEKHGIRFVSMRSLLAKLNYKPAVESHGI